MRAHRMIRHMQAHRYLAAGIALHVVQHERLPMLGRELAYSEGNALGAFLPQDVVIGSAALDDVVRIDDLLAAAATQQRQRRVLRYLEQPRRRLSTGRKPSARAPSALERFLNDVFRVVGVSYDRL